MAKYPKTLGRIEAVWNKLGGEEGVDRLLRDELEIVAKAVKSAPTSLLELIKTHAYDEVDPRITDELFPTPDRMWNDYKIFIIDRKFLSANVFSLEETLEKMRAKGYEPANSHEFLSWNGWDEIYPVFAPGSVVEVDGCRCMLFVDGRLTGRRLNLIRYSTKFGFGTSLLGVRSSTSLKTSKSSGS